MKIDVMIKGNEKTMYLTAENEAEEYRLQALKGALILADVSWSEFEAHEGRGDWLGLRFNLSRV